MVKVTIERGFRAVKGSKKFSTALKVPQFSERQKNEFQYDIGFIGAGNMGYAIAEGFKMTNPNLKILASDSNWNLDRVQKWNDIGSNQTQQNENIFENCRLVVLSVKPQSIQAVANELASHGTSEQILMSVIAGYSIESMRKSFPNVQNLVRIMTNTGCLIKEGAIAVTPSEEVPLDVVQEVMSLLNGFGLTELVPESSMDAVTGMSGSGIAFVYQVIQALEDGGVASGLSRDVASKFASQTALAAAKMVQQSDRDIQSLIDDVTSPAGTTYAGLQKAKEMGLSQAVQGAVQAAAERSFELSNISKK